MNSLYNVDQTNINKHASSRLLVEPQKKSSARNVINSNMFKTYQKLCISRINQQKQLESKIISTIQNNIVDPLKEILFLINLITTTEDKEDRQALMCEVNFLIKTLLANCNSYIKHIKQT